MRDFSTYRTKWHSPCYQGTNRLIAEPCVVVSFMSFIMNALTYTWLIDIPIYRYPRYLKICKCNNMMWFSFIETSGKWCQTLSFECGGYAQSFKIVKTIKPIDLTQSNLCFIPFPRLFPETQGCSLFCEAQCNILRLY